MATTDELLERAIETGTWADWQIALRQLRIDRGMISLPPVKALPRQTGPS